jgi:DNA-directed RNA polymerase subunit H (RpoH/RPB5)
MTTTTTTLSTTAAATDESLDAVYSALLRLCAYRGYTPLVAHSNTTSRHAFRLFARSATARIVALFVDMPGALRAKSELVDAAPCRAPSVAALDAAVAVANAESTTLMSADAAERQLIVLALHSDTRSHQLGRDVQRFIESIDLDVEARATVYIEHWHTSRQLAIDVLAHSDVTGRDPRDDDDDDEEEEKPVHRFATATERARYPLAQLPLIRLCDPVARWLGARTGDVLVEERDEHATGRVLYLRHVVARAGDA